MHTRKDEEEFIASTPTATMTYHVAQPDPGN